MDKGTTFPVLDHGYVKLIDSMGTDETIIEAARMSTKKSFISWDPYAECPTCGRAQAFDKVLVEGDRLTIDCLDHKMVAKPEGDQGLLEFLWKNSHATPFEMCELVIEVQAPIFVFREWHRHRTQSYNEMSARYTQMPNLHYVPDASRLKPVASKNKQEASIGDGEMDPDTALGFIVREQETVYADYEEMIQKGVPKEVARVNTPVARYSKMRAKTDLRNWLAFLNLRARQSAQWEIRQYAGVLCHIIEHLWPRTFRLFLEHTLNSRSFSYTELRVLLAYFSSPVNRDSLANVAADIDGMNVKRIKELLTKLSS